MVSAFSYQLNTDEEMYRYKGKIVISYKYIILTKVNAEISEYIGIA